MRRLLERIKFWSRCPEKGISVYLAVHTAGEDEEKSKRIFKLAHNHLKNMSKPDQIINEWLSLPDTEMVLYFKRTQSNKAKEITS